MFTKDDLLDKVFSEGFNEDKIKLKNLKNEIKSFMLDNGSDEDLKEAVLILDVLILENDVIYQEEATRIVTPILRRLGGKIDWNGLDKSFAYIVIAFSESVEQAISLLDKALKLDYVLEGTKIALLFNSSFYFVRAKYKEKTDLKKLTEKFDKIVALCLELCTASKNPKYNYIYYHVLLIRKNIFHRDDNAVKASLKALKSNKEIYRIIKEEVEEYQAYMKQGLERNELNEIIGKNLRTYRTNSGISIEEASKYIQTASSNLIAYEKGRRNPSSLHLGLLAKLYGITPDEIYFDKQDTEEALNLKLISSNYTTKKFYEDGTELVLETITRISKVVK